MNILDYECSGQMSLTDWLPSEKRVYKGPPILLSQGEHIFRVIKGDVEESIVGERTWTCGDENRGYDLSVIGRAYDTTWNNRLGVDYFKEKEKAYELAARNLNEMDCIRKEDVEAVKTVAYRYVFYDKEHIYFYSILKDGNIYMDATGTYAHISKNVEGDIEIFERCRKQFINNDSYEELTDYEPTYKNMYRCSHDSWLYAEARYNHQK